MTLRVGEAFTLADVLGERITDRRQAKTLATEAIMERIAALLPERHRGVYGHAAGGVPGAAAAEASAGEP